MVTSVQVIPMMPKTKKEKHRHSSSESSDKKKSFAYLLDQAIEDMDVVDCPATTYGPNSQLKTFHYPSKEYTC